MFRVIKGEKIKKARGGRSLREVARASNGAFSDAALLAWETYDWQQSHGKKAYRPTDDKIPALLIALGCSYEDISEPIEVVQA
jgi:hypothetical protein